MRIAKIILFISLIISLLGCNQNTPPAGMNVVLDASPSQILEQSLSPDILTTKTPTEPIIPTLPSAPILITNADKLLIYGDYQTAWNEYKLGSKATSDIKLASESLWGLSRVEYLIGSYDQSLAYIQQLLDQYPETSSAHRAYFLQGLNYDNLQRYSKAADSYKNYLQSNPGIIDSYVHEVRGDSLANSVNYREALADYQASVASGTTSDELELKIGRMHRNLGEFSLSIEIYQDIYSKTTNDYMKAQMDFLIGEIYYFQGLYENAYPYFLDAVNNFPVAYDSYSALLTLVTDGIPVNDFNRGLVDYFAEQFGPSMVAFDRYITDNPEHDGTVLHYKALLYRSLGDYQLAIDQWTELIDKYPDNIYWDSAWDERAYTMWGYEDEYQEGAQSLLDYVNMYPTLPNSPFYLNSAARIFERGGFLETAYSVWNRLSVDYPESDLVPDALFNAGIVLYRLEDYGRALVAFQKSLIFSNTPSAQAQSYLWIGKVQKKVGDTMSAQQSLQLAAGLDPSAYYSQRANALLTDQEGLSSSDFYDFAFNVDQERSEAETWLRITFQFPQSKDLSGLGELSLNERIIRGTEFWKLGLYNEATGEFSDLFNSIKDNPIACYLFANYLNGLGFNRLAINAYRQVLILAGMETYTQMLNAPAYFLHMNYGAYFQELIETNSRIYNLDSILLMSIIAQESGFDGYIRSSAGAIGLMQIIPSTGETIANSINWPENYSVLDLNRPIVNIRFGSAYLTMNRIYFNGDLYPTLAAYNAGPGNANIWRELSGSDPDLFLEVIRYPETKNYIENIYEIFQVYKSLYGSN